MIVKEEVYINVKSFFGLVIGVIMGVGGEMLHEADLIAGLILKIVSIISFSLVIVINWRKIINMLKRKNHDGDAQG